MQKSELKNKIMISKYSEILKTLKKTEIALNSDSRILIIDGLNTFIRAFAANPCMNDDGIHIGGIVGFLLSMGYAIKSFKPTRVIIAFDGSGGSQRRKKIYSEYKANRVANPKKPRFNRKYNFQNKKQEDQLMRLEMSRLIEYLENTPIQIITIDNIEADDTIAYIKTLFNNSNIIIMSSDRDFLQLVDKKTTVWSPTKKKHYTEKRVLEEYKVSSNNFILYKTILGDKSDNIPGIKGWGSKTILKKIDILKNIDNTYNLKDIFSYADKYNITKLLENKKILERNYKLMQLLDVNISGQNKLMIKNIVTSKINRFVKYKIQKMILQDKLFSGIKNSTVWLNTVFKNLDNFASKHNKKLDVNGR